MVQSSAAAARNRSMRLSSLNIDVHHVVELRYRVGMKVLQVAIEDVDVFTPVKNDRRHVPVELFLDDSIVSIALRLVEMRIQGVHCRVRALIAPVQIVLSVGWNLAARIQP